MQIPLFGPEIPELLAFGAGVDSSAILAIHLYRQKAADFLGIDIDLINEAVPDFDAVIFSDPGAEFPQTYENIEFSAKAVKRFSNKTRFVVTRKDGENITQWLERLGNVPLLPGGSHVCSLKFKGDVLEKWAKAEYGRDRAISWSIGIGADEDHRTKRFKPAKAGLSSYRYPLRQLGLNRETCVSLLNALAWPPVRKSSCFFCPFMSEGEIKELYSEFPGLWQLAKGIEARFRAESPRKHRAWLEAGKPVDSAGRALPGYWKKDAWKEGARLFAKQEEGERRSLNDWEKFFNN